MKWQTVVITILVGMLGLLVAWGQYIYFGLRVERYLLAHHRRLWESIASSSPFSIEPVVSPIAAVRFVLAFPGSEDGELKRRRLQARKALIIAFMSVPAFFVVFLAVLVLYSSQPPHPG